MPKTSYRKSSDSPSDGDDSPDYTETLSNPEFSSEDLKDSLAHFLTENAHSFTPMTQYFFTQAVIEQRPLYGANGLLIDEAFLGLVAADKSYADLDPDKLVAKLC
ncbi:MAG: hypothetical protein HOP02_07560 [Methylococcaceae bacterium]|nr:hypothetical protein [Methylococcaceae bacterium]